MHLCTRFQIWAEKECGMTDEESFVLYCGLDSARVGHNFDPNKVLFVMKSAIEKLGDRRIPEFSVPLHIATLPQD